MAVYRNSLTPSRLFGIILLLFSATALSIWATGLIASETPAFDSRGWILLGSGASLFVLSVLFFRRVGWARIVMSILVHLLGLALLATLLYTLPMVETTVEHVVVVAFTLLGVGLLIVAILVLHGNTMRSDLPAPTVHARWPRRRRYVALTASGMLVLLALVAWQVVPLVVAEPTITVDYLSQANQANKPVNYDPNRNAAPHTETLLSQFMPLPEALKGKWKWWPTDFGPDEIKALEEWVPVNESLLSALAQVARCPYWWYEMKSTDGALWGIQVPDLERIRNCTWGVLLLAEHKAAQGDTDGGLRLLTDLHGLAVHLAKGGTLVEQLVGVAICKLSYNAVLAILDHCPVESAALKRMLETFISRLPEIAVPRFSETEHLYGYDSVQRVFTDDGNGNGRLIPAQLYELKKSHATLYTHPISYLDAVRICLTHPDRRETLELGELYFMVVKDLAKQTPWDLHVKGTSYEKVLKKLLAGNYYLQDGLAGIGPCIRIGWRNRVTGDAMVTILAVFAYKAQEGRLPESLQQLVDKELIQTVPMDPYSAGPLIYKAQEHSFTLYSVGEDFVDDGGQPCEWYEEGGDAVFWPVPAAAP